MSQDESCSNGQIWYFPQNAFHTLIILEIWCTRDKKEICTIIDIGCLRKDQLVNKTQVDDIAEKLNPLLQLKNRLNIGKSFS